MIRPNLESLRLAVIAAQHRSLHKAAETLRVRQSTLSRRLRDLELELGVILFARSKGGTVPTEAGQVLIETTRRALGDIDDAVARAKSLVRGESGRLIVGVGAAVSAGSLTALLTEYGRLYPLVELMLADQVGGLPISERADQYVDIAIVMGPVAAGVGRSLPLWAERVVAVLPEAHLLASQAVVRWSDLETERLLVSRRTPELSRLAAVKLRPGATELVRVQDVGPDALPGLVRTGLGLALVTEGATGTAPAGVVFREIHDDGGPTRLPFTAGWRHDNRNPALKPFLDVLRDRYPDLSGSSFVP
jgi:DNA-binding transcriptional LysR family regulator